MTGETAQLQRLTDEQVGARLKAYNPGGSLERDVKLFKDHMLGFVVAEIGEQFGPDRADRYSAIYSGNIEYPYEGHRVVILHEGPGIGLPIVRFSAGPYSVR